MPTTEVEEPKVLESLEDVRELKEGDLFIIDGENRPNRYIGQNGDNVVGIRWLSEGVISVTEYFVKDGKLPRGFSTTWIPSQPKPRTEMAQIMEVEKFINYKHILESHGDYAPQPNPQE